jgi:hypothetical protein
VDLGQKRDHSALVVVEDALLNLGVRDRVTFALQVERRRVVRKVERIALGTQYRKVAIRVREMLDAKELQQQNIFVSVDATGVGNSVVEMLREELAGRRVALTPVVFTGPGVQHWQGRSCHVPRNELLDQVSLGLEGGLMRFPRKVPNIQELVEELRGMKRSHGWRGTPQWTTVGKHDDLVMALSLAWWGTGEWPVPLKAPRVFL